MNHVKLSIIIPCRDRNDPKLKELLASIDRQDFPKDEMEILIITEGTSESAKAIGIRKAKGEVIGIFASDNEIVKQGFLNEGYSNAAVYGAAHHIRYHYEPNDNILNRYFALFGVNDPLALYMSKNDRFPYYQDTVTFGYGTDTGTWPIDTRGRTLGDNGFFIRKDFIMTSSLDDYYHIDNANESSPKPKLLEGAIWHKTGGNIFSFFRKRYHYGLQHAFNKNRRWHLVDFRQSRDIWRLAWFIFATLSLVQPLCLSLRGYLKIRDLAWFLHPLVCLLTLLTYGLLIAHLGLRTLYQLLFARMAVQRA